MIHRRTATTARPALCESLESRVLLSAAPLVATGGSNVDIAITGISALKLDNSLVAGQSEKGSLKVTLANNGTDASGTATVTAVLHPLAGGSDIPITAKAGSAKAIPAGHSKPASLSLLVPDSLPAGSYQLVLTVDSSVDTNAANNTFTLPAFQLDAAAGNVSLSGDAELLKIPASFPTGKTEKGVLKTTLSNTGNLATTGGPAQVSIVLHPTSGDDVPLFSKTLKLPPVKAAGKPANLPAFPFTLPGTVPAGDYTVVITVTPTSPTATNPAITLTTAPFTVTDSTPTPGTSLLEHGDQITFSADTNLNGGPQNFLEMGSFVTDKNVHGSYRLTGTTLTLTYSASDIQTIPVTFTNNNLQFFDSAADEAGKKVKFSLDPTNAILSLTLPTTTSTQTVYAAFA